VQSRWIFPKQIDAILAARLAAEHGVPRIVADLLLAGGRAEAEEIERFLNPRLRSLSDPNLLPGMPAAIARIDRALRDNERIVLYGDYDVDGVTSLALLHRVFSAYGAKVECFLPLRAEEGYGLSDSGIERCVKLHASDLLIAVDCGTNSNKQIASLTARGVDVVVLDHHEPDSNRPQCSAVVNPKLGSDFLYLCSAGIAFKTAHALLKMSPLPDFDLRDVLDLVALATLCDLVPLIGENRILVRAGLTQLGRSRWPGVSALLAVAGVTPPVQASDAGFRLGPRINAAGRLGTAQEALQLLLTDDATEATRLAASLDGQNRERQAVERTVTLEVEAWVEANYDATRQVSIVAGARDWHQGVLGIVASRITRRHHRPTLIIGFDSTGQGKGSGRSIEGLSLVEALRDCQAHLGNFGGHEMAAGLNVCEDIFEVFRSAFEDAARRLVTDEMLVPRLRLDAELPLTAFDDDLLVAQQMLEPFGNGNRQPLLVARSVTPSAEPRVLKEKHLRIAFAGSRRQPVSAIFFNGAEHPLPRPPWDVAFHLERNEYNGRVQAQMQIVAIRSAS
jgi:single-stranded-DNA-specific exonuclease